jgi:hypothetical protein
MMVRDRNFDDLLPSIICGNFWLQGHTWRNGNVKDVLRRLERRYFWSRVHYSMTNIVKEPSLEQLVQLFRINIKMDGKSRPFMALVPISPAYVISSIVAPTEKVHLVAVVRQ